MSRLHLKHVSPLFFSLSQSLLAVQEIKISKTLRMSNDVKTVKKAEGENGQRTHKTLFQSCPALQGD